MPVYYDHSITAIAWQIVSKARVEVLLVPISRKEAEYTCNRGINFLFAWLQNVDRILWVR